MANQYDVTGFQKEVLEKKAQRRAQLREAFLRQAHNPNNFISGEGGAVFDPAIQRFMATKSNYYDHFKSNAKTSRIALLYMVVPMVGYAYLLKTRRENKEKLYRTGQVAYKDRLFKNF